MHVYVEESLIYEYEKIAADIQSSEKCSVVQRFKLARKPEALMPDHKTFRLFCAGAITDLGGLQIAARDASSGEMLPSSTAIEGRAIATTIPMTKLLAEGSSPEIEIEYGNLAANFYLGGLLRQPRLCEWAIRPDTQTKVMEAVIKLPKPLPDWVLKSEMRATPVPGDFADVATRIEQGGRCVVIRASDLKIGIAYRVRVETADA